LLYYTSLGKSQQFLDELEPYTKKRKNRLLLVEKQKLHAELSPPCQGGSTLPLTVVECKK
jgi:hypothetical protein